MTHDSRFPFPRAGLGRPSEANQIITIFTGNTIDQAGAATVFSSIAAWKKIEGATEVPYTEYVAEYTAVGPGTIGDGTFNQQIGLYGVIGDLITGEKFLLGVLGLSRGGVVPQIPLENAPDIGFAQKICDVGNYDGLAVAGLTNNIVVGENVLTVRIRPIRLRSYYG